MDLPQAGGAATPMSTPWPPGPEPAAGGRGSTALGRGRRIRAVSAVVTDAAGRYLLVLRTEDPEAGRWALPGGRVEPGETLEDAVVREVGEETGVRVRVARRAGVVERPSPGGGTYEIHCFVAEYLDGDAVAASDAGDIRWVHRTELSLLETTRGLVGALHEWRL